MRTEPMPLTDAQKRHLRALAHPLNPVIIVGNNGLSESLLKELDIQLEHHELIKVRANAEDRESRDELVRELCTRARAELVQRIGHIAVLYRAAAEPKLQLPKGK